MNTLKIKINDEIERMRRYLPDACYTVADCLKNDPSYPMSELPEVIQTVADYASDIGYCAEALDFIGDHWKDVDEHLKEADSLLGAVRLAAYDVTINEVNENLADTLTLATLYHLQKTGHDTIEGAELEAVKLYMDADVKTAGTFEDVLNGALNTAGIINA